MNDPVEHFFFVLFHRGWSEKQANETLTHYRSMLAAKQQAEADLKEWCKIFETEEERLRAENERLREELAEANKVGKDICAAHDDLEAENQRLQRDWVPGWMHERVVKHNKALMKIREDYDEHLRLCPQKSREKFKKAMEELEWYEETVAGLNEGADAREECLTELHEDGGQRARAVIEGEENETRIQEEKKAEGTTR